MNLICYLSNGDPTIEDSIRMAQTYVEAGCDVIEIDFPGRNPFLESEFIAKRMRSALEACNDYRQYMKGMAQVKKLLPDTRFLLLLYEDTLEEIGYDAFVAFCKANAFMDLILVGLKDDAIKDRLMADGLRVSCYVQYDLPDAEVMQAKHSNGFVYLQAKPTDGRRNPKYPELSQCIDYLRQQCVSRPIYCGVGVHTPEDVAMVKKAGADGAFVGSAILKLHDDREVLIREIQTFKANA